MTTQHSATQNMNPDVFGHSMRLLPRVDSTNAEALRLAREGAPEGLVVMAETQTLGRGRAGRRWLDRPGDSLLCSVLLRPRLTPAQIGVLPLAIGVGVATALKQYIGADAKLKWPNDIVTGPVNAGAASYRKLGGILVEREGDAYVAGIGLNVNGQAEGFPAELRDTIATLQMATGQRIEPQTIAGPVLAFCEQAYFELLRGGATCIRNRFAQLDICLGRQVVVTRSEGSLIGLASGIAPDGGLIVEMVTGEETVVYAGDVSVRPTSCGECSAS